QVLPRAHRTADPRHGPRPTDLPGHRRGAQRAAVCGARARRGRPVRALAPGDRGAGCGRPSAGTQVMKKTRILVVDDEPQIGRMLRTQLSARGYEVEHVSTGNDALLA